MNKNQITTGVMSLGSVVGLVLLAAIVAYTIQNQSGHTGFSPSLALVVFLPLTLAGGAYFVALRNTHPARRLGIISLAIGLAGIALLLYLDKSNILVQYDVWLSRGMP